MEIEKRLWKPELQELRAESTSDGRTKITGLAVPYNQTSEDLGGFREIFSPGAFADTITEGRDVFADVEHDATKKLGRRQNESVELQDGENGLRVAITLPKTQLGADTAEEVRTKLLDGMSIAFGDAEAEWMGRGTDTIRKVTKATLRAVTLTSYPAYRQTVGTLALRSLADYQASQGSTEPPPPPSAGDADTLRRKVLEELAK